jgi:type I restriction enzyme, S subunit
MAVKAGYKQTEVGIIPEDWEVKTYGDIFDFLTTATYSRAELTEVDDVKYVHYGDIHTKWNFFLDVKLSNLPTIRDTQVKKYNLLKDGDIIMADASEDYTGVGKSVEVKNLGLVQAISGQHTFLLRDKNEVFVNGFRGYIHFIKAVKTQFDQLATGLKVYSVSKGNLKVVKIPVPTKLEQTLIATALSDADALISTLKNLISLGVSSPPLAA